MKKFFITMFVFLSVCGLTSANAVEDIVSLDEIEQSAAHYDLLELDSQKVPLQAEISFDWLDITQVQRDENIEKYHKLLFDDNTSRIYFTKQEFKTQFANYFKDRDFKHHYFLTNNGVTEDEEAKYCAFFYKKNTLVMYAIQYKNNPTNAFYYNAFGKLYYTDVISKEYPNFPYTSMQYNRKGELKSAIYFVSRDIQYMFGPEKEFQGVWYKDKMYDKNGKQTLTRNNW